MKKIVTLIFMLLLCNGTIANAKIADYIVENEEEKFFCSQITDIAAYVMNEKSKGASQESMLDDNSKYFMGHEKDVREAIIKLGYIESYTKITEARIADFSKKMMSTCILNTSFLGVEKKASSK